MRVEMAEFWRLLEDASEVHSDPTGQYYLVRLPGEGWRLYQRGIEAAFLLAEGEEALFWAPEFRVSAAG
ncbi:hypothetical protein [Thermus sp.]|uniref:hypothetical protein n=1 Tax=Thermus sp. TaxID=275 RepID=UPI0025FFECF4|nr:hypothetical protein [Thermus sp.]MCS6867190.1 hypothetical protein [Thermus sp.]MDW8358501.1 hypothetical protein [Thermus sp.]